MSRMPLFAIGLLTAGIASATPTQAERGRAPSSPAEDCCVCIHLDRHVAATTSVVSEGRDHKACDEHGPVIARIGLAKAIRQALLSTGIGGIGAV